MRNGQAPAHPPPDVLAWLLAEAEAELAKAGYTAELRVTRPPGLRAPGARSDLRVVRLELSPAGVVLTAAPEEGDRPEGKAAC